MTALSRSVDRRSYLTLAGATLGALATAIGQADANIGNIALEASTDQVDTNSNNNTAAITLSAIPRIGLDGSVIGYTCQLGLLPDPEPTTVAASLRFEERVCGTMWDPVCHGLYNDGSRTDAHVKVYAQTCAGNYVLMEEKDCPDLGVCYFYGDNDLHPGGYFTGMVYADVTIDGQTVRVTDGWVGNNCP